MSTRPHGYARYKLDGCRCYTCGWAVAQYNDAREHALRRGTWQPYVDAAPVRAHVRALQQSGLGARRIADLARVERKTIVVLLNGRTDRSTPPPQRIRPATAAALLSVEPTLDDLGAHTPIDATGTQRRLQALVAAGWPQRRLAERLGMTAPNFGASMKRTRVTVSTVRAVNTLYDDLWRVDPREHGVTGQAYSRARNTAYRNCWAPVGAWDDDTIDDPTATADWTGRCGTPQGVGAHRRAGIPVCQPCRDARSTSRTAVTA
ncbi:hypothetical protein [Streptomyces boncukensis]|uniref:Uncharacterized protein n=1 Tax=Streptomyces boncukensis TaxID=2711219 RepID=A0A6G4WXA6_9ACTN|nr:hypothetical protein [Streptomyces boncukensis]NGO69154.1 hypothetical protein [Streptomyces boncukensis]